MRVESLHIYPLKSARAMSLDEAEVQPWGLAGDRRWGVVDRDGNRVTSWDRPALQRITAVPAEGGLRLTAPGREPLEVRYPANGLHTAVGYSRLETARPAAGEASGWVSDVLGEQVVLVWLDDPRRRPVSAAHAGQDGDVLSLADAGPLLLTSLASLAQIQAWAAEIAAERGEPAAQSLSMARFRPNVVIDGEAAFAEDGWSKVRIGSVELRFGELCDRCVITTIDPRDQSLGKEPMRTLARHRRWNGETWFGTRMIPLSTGLIRVGDFVEIS